MSGSDVFGWFGSLTPLVWLALIGGVLFFLWRRGSEWVTGHRFALLFYSMAFFVVLEYAKRIGDAVHAPIPITVILLLCYGLGFYHIWKGGGKSG